MQKITNKQELTQQVTGFIDDEAKLEVLFYVTTKDNKLLKLDLDENNAESLIADYKKEIRRAVVDNEYQIKSYSTSEDRRHCYFVYDLADKPDVFENIIKAGIDNGINTFSKNNGDKLTDVTGIITVIADGKKIVKLYRPIYTFDKIITKDRHLFVFEADSRFVRLSSEALNISPAFSVIYVEGDFVIVDIDKIERNLNLHDIIINEARSLAKGLERLSLIENIDFISQTVSTNVRLAKKLISTLKNSRVLLKGIPAEHIIAFAKSKCRQIGKISINEEVQMLSPKHKTEVERIIKLLSDDLLKSELTEEEYDSSVKDLIRVNNDERNN